MKRTGIKRSSPDKIREWQRKSRRPIPRQSAKRAATNTARAAVRHFAIDRDRGCVAEGIDSVPHGRIGDRAWLDVHELAGGSRRHETFLLVEWTICLCPLTHDWVTEHPLAAERRGLRLPSYADDGLLEEAALLRSLWARGVTPGFPSWWGPDEVATASAIEKALH